MQQILSSLVTIFRNPPPPIIPLNVIASHYLYTFYSSSRDIDSAILETKRKMARILYKEFDTDIKVVGSSDKHVYWQIPDKLKALFDTLDETVESEASLLLHMQSIGDKHV